MNAPKLKNRHPHIHDKISNLWGSRECYDELIAYIAYDYDPTRGNREGFEPYILTELLQVVNEHTTLYPYFAPDCPWRGNV